MALFSSFHSVDWCRYYYKCKHLEEALSLSWISVPADKKPSPDCYSLPDNFRFHPMKTVEDFERLDKNCNSLLHSVCSDNDTCLFETALRLGDTLHSLFIAHNMEGQTCLHIAAAKGHVEIFDSCLLHNWAMALIFEARNRRRQTCLHTAIEHGQYSLAEMLIGIVSDPDYLIDECDNEGNSCMADIIRSQRTDALERVINRNDEAGSSDEIMGNFVQSKEFHSLKLTLQQFELFIPYIINVAQTDKLKRAISRLRDIGLASEFVDIERLGLVKKWTIEQAMLLIPYLAINHHADILEEVIGCLNQAKNLEPFEEILRDFICSEKDGSLKSLTRDEVLLLNQYGEYILSSRNTKMVAVVAVNHFIGADNERIGSDKEATTLVESLQKIGFLVERIDDWENSEGLVQQLERIISNHKSKMVCWTLCLLSHGSYGSITGADQRSYKISDILKEIQEPLHGYFPKIVIIQACQLAMNSDNDVSRSTEAQCDPHPDKLKPSSGNITPTDYKHWCLVLPAGENKRVCRNVFIPMLAEQLSQCTGELTFMEILNKLTRRMVNQGIDAPQTKLSLCGEIRFKCKTL